MDLSLRFKSNGTGHDDVELRLEEHAWVCDSYYFAIDRNVLPERRDDPKIRTVLRRLLEQWASAVRNLQDGAVVFLPYDFSDEYTGWLSCTRRGAVIDVSRGWALVEGWSISPSDVGSHLSSLRDFRLDGPTLQGTVDELAQAIQRSILEL